MSKRELTIPVSELAAICNGVMGGVVNNYHHCMKNKDECVKNHDDAIRYSAWLEGAVSALDTMLTLYEAQNIYALVQRESDDKELKKLKDVVYAFKFRVIGKMDDDIMDIVTDK